MQRSFPHSRVPKMYFDLCHAIRIHFPCVLTFCAWKSISLSLISLHGCRLHLPRHMYTFFFFFNRELGLLCSWEQGEGVERQKERAEIKSPRVGSSMGWATQVPLVCILFKVSELLSYSLSFLNYSGQSLTQASSKCLLSHFRCFSND